VRLGYRIKALQKSMGGKQEEEESLSPICVSSSEREFGVAAA
jgi:hypothetical protein